MMTTIRRITDDEALRDEPSTRDPRRVRMLLALGLALALTLGVSACGSDSAEDAAEEADDDLVSVSGDVAVEGGEADDADAGDRNGSSDDEDASSEDGAVAPPRLARVDEADSVLAVIDEHPNLTRFAELIADYPQRQIFTQARGVTLLIPDDDAFDAMGSAYGDLAADDNALTLFISEHLSIGTMDSAELVEAGVFPNALARSLPVSEDDGTVTVGGATVVEADLVSENGVIHIVDRPVDGDDG